MPKITFNGREYEYAVDEKGNLDMDDPGFSELPQGLQDELMEKEAARGPEKDSGDIALDNLSKEMDAKQKSNADAFMAGLEQTNPELANTLKENNKQAQAVNNFFSNYGQSSQKSKKQPTSTQPQKKQPTSSQPQKKQPASSQPQKKQPTKTAPGNKAKAAPVKQEKTGKKGPSVSSKNLKANLNTLRQRLEREGALAPRDFQVTGRNNPNQARDKEFLAMKWKGSEIAVSADKAIKDAQFRKDFISAADELLGAGRFLLSGSDEYGKLKKEVADCKKLMQKVGKNPSPELKQQLQEKMNSIIDKTSDYFAHKSEYAGDTDKLMKQSSTAQNRYFAANKMWNLLVDKTLEANKLYKASQPKVEQPKVEQPKAPQQPKVEQPKVEQPKVEQPKVEQPKVEQPASQKIPINITRTSANINGIRANAMLKLVMTAEKKFAAKSPKVQARRQNYLDNKAKAFAMESVKVDLSGMIRKSIMNKDMGALKVNLAKMICINYNQSIYNRNAVTTDAKQSKALTDAQINARVESMTKGKLLDKYCNSLMQTPSKVNKILNDTKAEGPGFEDKEAIKNLLTLGTALKMNGPAPEKQMDALQNNANVLNNGQGQIPVKNNEGGIGF